MSPDEIARYQGAVRAVTTEQALAAAGAVFAPSAATVVIVGDAKQFLDGLRRLRADVTVIPFRKLELDKLDLSGAR